MQPTLRALRVIALALAATSCTNDTIDDEFDGLGSLERGVGPTCAEGELCFGSGATYTASYRLGTTPTSRGEFVQTFTATGSGAPTEVRLTVRNLRQWTLAPAAAPPALHVDVYAEPAPTRPTLAPQHLVATGEITLPQGGPVPLTVPLSPVASTTAGSTYAVHVWTDELPSGTTGALLLGVEAWATDTYSPAGAAFRRTLRRPGSTGEFGATRVRPAGPYQLALALGFTSCPDGSDAAHAGLSCEAIRPCNAASGTRFIDPDGAGPGAAFPVQCDQDTDGGGWTLVTGASNPTNQCASWAAVGTAVQLTCAADHADLDCTSDTCSGRLELAAPFDFRWLRYTGTPFSSGGTNSPCWDEPDAQARTGDYTCHGCGDAHAYTRTIDFGAEAPNAGWFAWSDYGNVCGGSGSYWHLSEVWIKDDRSPPPPCIDGSTQASAAPSCLAILTSCGPTPDGPRWIDGDGAGPLAPALLGCDMTNGGWTHVTGTAAACPFWTDGGSTAATVTCSASGVNLDCTSNTCTGKLRLAPGIPFQLLHFVGAVSSSGGTNAPCWDWPDEADRQGDYTCHSCADNTTWDRTVDFGSPALTASWFTWSDYGDVCGGGGAWWHLTDAWVK